MIKKIDLNDCEKCKFYYGLGKYSLKVNCGYYPRNNGFNFGCIEKGKVRCNNGVERKTQLGDIV